MLPKQGTYLALGAKKDRCWSATQKPMEISVRDPSDCTQLAVKWECLAHDELLFRGEASGRSLDHGGNGSCQVIPSFEWRTGKHNLRLEHQWSVRKSGPQHSAWAATGPAKSLQNKMRAIGPLSLFASCLPFFWPEQTRLHCFGIVTQLLSVIFRSGTKTVRCGWLSPSFSRRAAHGARSWACPCLVLWPFKRCAWHFCKDTKSETIQSHFSEEPPST